MKNRIEKLIDSLKPEMEKDLSDLISVRSLKGERKELYPYGEEIGKVLEVGLNIGKKLGFNTKNVDGYACILELGESDDYIGVFGHLDVVPEGTGWDTPPYELVKKGGRFYGRGVLDNKGPILAAIYGVKILKELGIKFKRKVRIVLGTDEESGMSDMEYYLSKEPIPAMGFTPDCKFPVVYGENGFFRLKISYPLEVNKEFLLNSIVGDYSKAYIPDYSKISYTQVEKIFEVEGIGKKAPSNNPYLGDNSLVKAIKNIPEVVLKNSDFGYIFEEIVNLFSDVYGENLGIKYKNPETGEVLVSLYEIKKNEDKVEVYVSVRYPVDCDENIILKNIKSKVKGKSKIEFSMPRVVKEKNSEMVRKMSEAYLEITNLDSTPVTTTGGTYARKIPNIVAFGPSFPGEKGIAHNKNEYMDEEHFYKLVKIYALAIYKLLEIN